MPNQLDSFCIVGTNGGQVRRIESSTLAVSSLPNTAKGISCLKVIEEDNIWAGHFSHPKAEISHYDGTTWTLYTISASYTNPYSPSLPWKIGNIFKSVEGNIWAMGAAFNGAMQLFKYNATGDSWSVETTINAGSRLPRMHDNVSETDMWSDGFTINIQHSMANWNGTSVVESSPVQSPTFLSGRSISGIARRNDGTVYIALDNNNPRRRTGPFTWEDAFSATTEINNAEPGNTIWHNPRTDDLWFITSDSAPGQTGEGFHKFDGTTATRYIGDSFGFTGGGTVEGITKEANSPNVQLFCSRSASIVHVSEPESNDWSTIFLSGTTGSFGTLDVYQGSLDFPPSVENRSPAPSEANVAKVATITFDVVDPNDNLDQSRTEIYINGVLAWIFGSPTSEFTGSATPITNGFNYSIAPNIGLPAGLNTIRLLSYDDSNNQLDETWSFTVIDPFLKQQVKTLFGGVVRKPKQVRRLNQFDEHGSLLSLPRLKGEDNRSYKRRIQDAAVHLANSSYRGLINGVTRELGLSLFNGITVNPKQNTSGVFLAPDPYIVFDGVWLLLYSDYKNNSLDWAIDRFQPGGNYEHLGSLVDTINNTSMFEASIYGNVDPYTKSMSIINQSNKRQVKVDILPQTTRFKLSHPYLVPGTVFFSNRETFRNEKSDVSSVLRKGDFYIDYQKAIVTCYNMPKPQEYARYKYLQYPFHALASPVILNDINNANFKIKLFEQIQMDNGDFENGLPTELGTDIINELMTVSPMYWGI